MPYNIEEKQQDWSIGQLFYNSKNRLTFLFKILLSEIGMGKNKHTCPIEKMAKNGLHLSLNISVKCSLEVEYKDLFLKILHI